MITGWLGKEEVFANRKEECRPLKEFGIYFLPPPLFPHNPDPITSLHGFLLRVPGTVNTVTEIRCGQIC